MKFNHLQFKHYYLWQVKYKLGVNFLQADHPGVIETLLLFKHIVVGFSAFWKRKGHERGHERNDTVVFHQIANK